MTRDEQIGILETLNTSSTKHLALIISKCLQSQHANDSLTPIDGKIRLAILAAIKRNNKDDFVNFVDAIMGRVAQECNEYQYVIKPSADFEQTKIWEIDYA